VNSCAPQQKAAALIAIGSACWRFGAGDIPSAQAAKAARYIMGQ